MWECLNANHICPVSARMDGWGVYSPYLSSVVTLVGHWPGDGGASTMIEVELPLYSVAITALSCISDPNLLEQKP